MLEAIYSGDIRAVVFDADDTLWDCQSHFESVQDRYGRLLSSYGLAPEWRKPVFHRMPQHAVVGLWCEGVYYFPH